MERSLADNLAGHYESSDDKVPSFVADSVAEIISVEVQQDVHRLMTVITSRPSITSLFQSPGRGVSAKKLYTRRANGVKRKACTG